MTMSDTGRDPGSQGLPDEEPGGGRGGDIGGRSGDDWGNDHPDETDPAVTQADEDPGTEERPMSDPDDGPGGGRGGDIGGRLT